jgi:hypothetical protein
MYVYNPLAFDATETTEAAKLTVSPFLKETIIMPRAFSNSVRTDDYAEDIHASLPAYHPIRITHHLASAPEYNLVYQDVYSAGNKIMCDFGPFTVNRSYKNKSEAFKLPKDYVWPPVDIMAHNLDTIREIMSQITPTKINAGFDKIVNPLTG